MLKELNADRDFSVLEGEYCEDQALGHGAVGIKAATLGGINN